MAKKILHNRVNRDVLKEKIKRTNQSRTTASFYRYTRIEDPFLFRDDLYLHLSKIDVLGRIYIAREGINAQISVPSARIDDLRKLLNQIECLKGCHINLAIDDGLSFYKLAIKVRNKIVADGLEDDNLDVSDNARHIDASEFNELINQDDTVVIDMRNHYESEVGHFEGAICPDVETFRESLPIVENILTENRDKQVIMYCTGGIRCEKATAYYKSKGYENLLQLEGGIIEYARQASEKGLENKFLGKNFVFDDRLGERISNEVIAHCHQCGSACDQHVNCANDACHLLFIQCESCRVKYAACCSTKCAEFNKLPEEQRRSKRKTEKFNGSRFGKGRYKAHRPGEGLNIE